MAEPLARLGACSRVRTSSGPAAIRAWLGVCASQGGTTSHLLPHQGWCRFPGVHALSPLAGAWPGEAAGFRRSAAGGACVTALLHSCLSLALIRTNGAFLACCLLTKPESCLSQHFLHIVIIIIIILKKPFSSGGIGFSDLNSLGPSVISLP